MRDFTEGCAERRRHASERHVVLDVLGGALGDLEADAGGVEAEEVLGREDEAEVVLGGEEGGELPGEAVEAVEVVGGVLVGRGGVPGLGGAGGLEAAGAGGG